MKSKIVKILMLLVISLTTFSCSEDEVLEPSLEVTPITLQGTWKLAELNGEQLPEDFYIYIEFDRKGNFEMYQKHDSMYPRYITGTYSVEKDGHIRQRDTPCNSPDSTEWYMLYNARNIPNGITGESESRTPRLQKISWDENNMPILGKPVRLGKPLPKPSGIVKK
jgi:hypothetical protein